MLRRLLAALLLLVSATPALGWGRQGHRAVATVASQRLNPQARAAVERLLRDNRDGKSLPAISMWADWVRFEKMPETYNWHFVNFPLSRTYDPGRDCRYVAGKGDCIVAALQRMRDVLADSRRSHRDRTEALMFVVHLVGDLHQPLHVVERDGDRGATEVDVVWLGEAERRRRGRRPERWTLHAVWDDGLLDAADRNTAQLVVALNAWLATQNEAELRRGGVVEWTDEAHAVAGEQAYRDADGRNIPRRGARLGRDYLRARLPVAERQLAVAGVRLAQMLNGGLGAGD
jgi:hypothetical protein